MWRTVLAVTATIVVSAACKRELNPEFCLAHPDDLRCGEIDAPPPPCSSNADCPGQICDIPNERCVDCTPDDVSLCTTATAPVCAADNTCHGCVVDDDCAAAVCLPDGSCPAEADIIYAAIPGSGQSDCGAPTDPCTLTQAISNADATHKIIKVAPDATQDYTFSGSGGLTIDKDVTIDMRGARIRKLSSGAAVTIGSNKNVTLLGGAITGGMNGGDGITCVTGVLTVLGTDIGGNSGSGIGDTGCGVVVDAASIHNNSFGINKANGNLTLTRSEIRSNVSGGVLVTVAGTRFTIVGNVFWSNGSAGTLFGGASLTTDTSTQSRLEFNSFNSNINNGNPGAALICNVAGFTARNNVLFGNGNNDQTFGTCAHVFSVSAPGNPLAGQGNSASDPMFANAAVGDLHTQPGSPTENAGDPAADLTGIAAFDRDGDPRTAPVDIGVDQHP